MCWPTRTACGSGHGTSCFPVTGASAAAPTSASAPPCRPTCALSITFHRVSYLRLYSSPRISAAPSWPFSLLAGQLLHAGRRKQHQPTGSAQRPLTDTTLSAPTRRRMAHAGAGRRRMAHVTDDTHKRTTLHCCRRGQQRLRPPLSGARACPFDVDSLDPDVAAEADEVKALAEHRTGRAGCASSNQRFKIKTVHLVCCLRYQPVESEEGEGAGLVSYVCCLAHRFATGCIFYRVTLRRLSLATHIRTPVKKPRSRSRLNVFSCPDDAQGSGGR